MKIKISNKELRKKLSGIQGIVGKSSTMPVLSHFLLDVKEDKSTIYATDLEIAFKEPLELIEKEGEVTLCPPAKRLYEIAKEVNDDIVIEVESPEWIRVRSGKATFKIACLSPDDYPHLSISEDKKSLTIHSETLRPMIEKTIYSAGESDVRYTLNGIHFHLKGKENELTIVGTDGHRLAVITTDVESEFDEEIKVIVPRKAALELKKLLYAVDDEITIEITANHIRFDLGEKILLTNLIEGTYPDYEKVIPSENENKLLINREEFIGALKRVSVMSRENGNSVKFDVAEKEMNITSMVPEIGEADDRIYSEYSGEPFTIGFNAGYVISALETMDSANVTFEINSSLEPTLLREQGNDNYRCVLMPMRT